MLSILSWILTGLIVGVIARAIVPGRQNLGWIMTIILGIVGAFVGGLIWSFIGGGNTWSGDPDVNTMWPGWIMAIIGGVVVLGAYIMITGRKNIATRS
jgi:uncharacterized membrane protein YeaQ/YmgE (transglycosylase-associated protein family)